MRILVTIKPQMYRETLALALQRYRPDAEVMLAPADSLDGQVVDFAPDLLVRSDDDGLSPEHLNAVVCRVEILYTDNMGARINLNGRTGEIEDMTVEDLLAVVDELEEFISGKPVD